MSHIPNKAMHHAHVELEDAGATGGGELGGVPDKIGTGTAALGWTLGAIGVGAVAAIALLSLRSSSAKPMPKRRRAAAPRRAPSKRKKAAA